MTQNLMLIAVVVRCGPAEQNAARMPTYGANALSSDCVLLELKREFDSPEEQPLLCARGARAVRVLLHKPSHI